MTGVPFNQFVLKLHSRCNLACDYCYVYELADQSWRTQPLQMSEETLGDTIGRISEHVRTHHLGSVTVILHGGEPLLAGARFVADFAARLRASVPAEVAISMQTNGTLLTRSALEILVQQQVRIGVSLDGDTWATGRHRLFHDGRNSHWQVERALRLLGQDQFRHCFGGILCTVDLANNPITTYEALLEYAPPAIDFLLPHGTWSSPPAGRLTGSWTTPYADWLLAIFDRWYANPATSVRIFREAIQLLLGGVGAVEGLGLRPSTLIVVDTDGTIKQLDSLNVTYPGAADLALNVASHPFDLAITHPLTMMRQSGLAALSKNCLSCVIVRTCGGGLFAHRYLEGSGFVNPSVYCPDLFRLITGIRDRIGRDLPGNVSTVLYQH